MTTPDQIQAYQLLLALVNDPVDADHLEKLLRQHIDWDDLFAQASRHEVLPLVYQGLKQVTTHVPPEILTRYQNLFAANTLRNLQLHKELQSLIQRFQKAGLPVIPYKGAVLAETAYGDLALRMFRDLDLLVPADKVRQAVRLLEGVGYRLETEWPEARWPSLLKTINHLLLRHADTGWAVEVHWMVFHPMYVLPFDLEPYWSDRAGGVGGTTRLNNTDQLLMLCTHGTKHHWELLKWIVDVRQLVNRAQDLDWTRLWAFASRNGLCRCLLLGLELAGRIGYCDVPRSIQEKIGAEPVIRELADSAWTALFRVDSGRRRFLWEYRFYLRSRERWGDRLKQLGRWLFYPRLEDWLAFPAGDRFFPLFVLGRPFRLVWKWVVRPMVGKVRGEG